MALNTDVRRCRRSAAESALPAVHVHRAWRNFAAAHAPGETGRSTDLISHPRVLIVDEQEETRQVLRTVLERRGMQILEASRADRGLELARNHHPNLIVMDVELQTASPPDVSAGFAAETAEHDTPVILLGAVRQGSSRPRSGDVVSKPYHYGLLIRKIEELLAKAG